MMNHLWVGIESTRFGSNVLTSYPIWIWKQKVEMMGDSLCLLGKDFFLILNMDHLTPRFHWMGVSIQGPMVRLYPMFFFLSLLKEQ